MSAGRLVTLPSMSTTPEIPQINRELRQLRLDAQFSQVQLGRLIGLDQSTISTVEKGASTTSTTIHAWVSACKGQITVIPAKADPWLGIPELLRPVAVEVARLWCDAPEDVRSGILLALRGFSRKA